MASLNRVQIIGRLGNDPITKFMTNGEPVSTLSIATSETWKDKATGAKKEKTEWHRVTFYRGLASVAAEYLKKGSLVYIEGRLETRKWTDKAGAEKYSTEIIGDKLEMLGGKKDDLAVMVETAKDDTWTF